jgi:ribosomal protein S27E
LNALFKDEGRAGNTARTKVQTASPRNYPDFIANLAEEGKYLPKYFGREFDEFLRRGRLEHDCLRVVCGDCKHEKLVVFSCKKRGFCPSCGARRMAESAAVIKARQ